MLHLVIVAPFAVGSDVSLLILMLGSCNTCDYSCSNHTLLHELLYRVCYSRSSNFGCDSYYRSKWCGTTHCNLCLEYSCTCHTENDVTLSDGEYEKSLKGESLRCKRLILHYCSTCPQTPMLSTLHWHHPDNQVQRHPDISVFYEDYISFFQRSVWRYGLNEKLQS